MMRSLWFGAAIVVALAAVTALVVLPPKPPRAFDRRDPLAALAHALDGRRPFDVAIVGLDDRASRPPDRDRPGAWDPPAAVRLATAEIENALNTSDDPADMAALGVALLLEHRLDEAVARLEAVARARPDHAPAWSNLAAAYLVRSEATRRLLDAVRALDAAERAVARAPGLREAVANRDLARRRAQVPPESPAPARGSWDADRAAWLDVIHPVDRQQADDAARRDAQFVRELIEDDLLPAWGRAWLDRRGGDAERLLERARLLADALASAGGDRITLDAVRAIAAAAGSGAIGDRLAAGHADFGEARALLARDRWQESSQVFAQSASHLRAGSSPFALAADQQVAAAAYGRRELTVLRDQLVTLEPEARARGYRVLTGKIAWVRGLGLLQEARVSEALDSYLTAAAEFRAVGEHENEAGANNLAADALRVLGEHHASWNLLGQALEKLPHIRSTRRRFVILLNAVLFSEQAGLPHAALPFQNAALAIARADSGSSAVVEAYIHRARLHRWLDDAAAADRDLEAGRLALTSVHDSELRPYFESWLDATMGEAAVASDPRRAQQLLSRALHSYGRLEPDERPFLYLSLARAHVAVGATDGARQAFLQGIADAESRRTRLTQEHRVAYADTMARLYQELADLELSDRAPDRAFATLERGRGRSLSAHAGPLPDIDHIRARLPHGTSIVFYAVSRARVSWWVLRRDGWRFGQVPWDATAVASDVEALRAAARPGGANDAPAGAASRLYDLLVRPLADAIAPDDRIVFVPDGPLARVPFAALMSRDDGTYLIERHGVTMAPSASSAAPVSVRPTGRHPSAVRTLLIAAPEGGGARLQLPRLPRAEQEVREIARLYPAADVLIGRDATRSAVLASAREASILHFAGHALANEANPWLSRLVLGSPDTLGDPDELMAYDLTPDAVGQLSLVVLAACRTADGELYRSEGVISIARVFLEAGVRHVVAALADVDDRATGELLRAFHEEYRVRPDPAEALRAAQLRMIRSGDRVLSSPGNWAMFTVLGAASRPSGSAGKELP